MKRSNFLLSALFLAAAFVACDNDDDAPKSLSFNPSKVEVFISQKDTVSVTGGTTPLAVSVADSTIAKAKTDNNKVIVTGVKEGSTVVTVVDKNKVSGKLNVTVKKQS
jgi:Pilus formation protein N terminal region